MYLDICLCGEVVCLVLQVERVEPLKQGEIETKVKIWVTPDSLCQCTCSKATKITLLQFTKTSHYSSLIPRLPNLFNVPQGTLKRLGSLGMRLPLFQILANAREKNKPSMCYNF